MLFCIIPNRLSSLTTYYIPKDGNPDSYMDFINILPNIDNPEAFGQHSNADITSLITEARCLCETLMSLQVQSSGGEQESKEEKVNITVLLAFLLEQYQYLKIEYYL